MPRPWKRKEGQTSQKGVVCWGFVALGQSSFMRWSLGEKRGETGETETARGNVCVCEGGRCKTEDRREVWVLASEWGCLETLCRVGWAGVWEQSRGCLCAQWVSEQEQTRMKPSPELGWGQPVAGWEHRLRWGRTAQRLQGGREPGSLGGCRSARSSLWQQPGSRLMASEPFCLCFFPLCPILGAVGIAVTNHMWQMPLDSWAMEALFTVSALRLGAQNHVWL